ncbi:NUDIX domain-containing protein [Tepidamorphus sp. 3E244]|uniref:NUDIX domain-containing protein n=1 Tax=Tepidamorphus sp. 3E244 TaxID=3385498 RepID=UPI0038FD3B0E
MNTLLSRFVFRPYWRLTRAMTLGVRGVVTNGDGHVLLVRHSYTPGWHFPGGGVERGETMRIALARELQEEGGVQPTAPPRLHGIYTTQNFSGDHVGLFIVDAWEAVPSSHGHEITGCDFFPLDSLPDDTTKGTRLRLAEIHEGQAASDFWSDS